eukprot:TRINITY_DN9954_c0_g1_i1.p1 TRINITY_DN9954_c0_g1~~TRINITY_DN9954_c0_g1_i1.p1  ORF type:complete len:501 (+),score=-2.22 TRINITY_DN9954_c0_g1_i1:1309-2811(+)
MTANHRFLTVARNSGDGASHGSTSLTLPRGIQAQRLDPSSAPRRRAPRADASRRSAVLFLTVTVLALLATLPAAVHCKQTAAGGVVGAIKRTPGKIKKAVKGAVDKVKGALDPNSAGGNCAASSLKGFQWTVSLDSDLALHWTTSGNTVKIGLEAKAGSPAARGWLGLGFSEGGAMTPSDAVIGTGGSVNAYRISGYSSAAVAQTNAFKPQRASRTEALMRTLMVFSRSFGDGGSVPVKPNGVNNLIWAYSPSGSDAIAYHAGSCGSTQVDFSCSTSPDNSTDGGSSGGGSSGGGSSGGGSSGGGSSGGGSSGGSSGDEGSTGSACSASTLSGYHFQAQLWDNNLLLHWKKPVGQVVQMALEARSWPPKSGWYAVAWSRDGRMVPSDAVIGNRAGGATGAYTLAGEKMGQILPAKFPLGNGYGTTTSSGSTVIKFSRTANTGAAAPFKLSGPSMLIWAYSPTGSKTFGDHKKSFGRIQVDFSCFTAPSKGTMGKSDPDKY